jgi:membrane-bound serine protease (ClpP class)
MGLASSFMAPDTSRAADSSDKDRPKVLEAPIEGAIDPVTKEWVERTISRAQDDDFDAVVFTMDTPGGLSTSMDDIVKSIVNAEDIPIFVWVGPRGARAASAGAFILNSSDIAAMAPSTNVGSATPVTSNGGDIPKDLRKKVINDAATKNVTLARDHGRDEKFAEDAVREAANIDEQEALDRGVIEYVASSVEDLLDQADGRQTKPKDLTVSTKNAEIERTELPFTLRFLKLIIDPNVLFLLFSAGLLGLAFEITHPGTLFPGVVGGLCLIIALFGFQVLPINAAGIILMFLAFGLFLSEAFVVSHGVLGAGGAVALAVGGALLFDRDSGYSVDLWLVILVGLLFAGLFGFVIRKAMDARKAPVQTGEEVMMSQEALVHTDLDPVGSVFYDGATWSARVLDDGSLTTPSPIVAGDTVRITGRDGLTLIVQKVIDTESAMPGGAAGTLGDVPAPDLDPFPMSESVAELADADSSSSESTKE